MGGNNRMQLFRISCSQAVQQLRDRSDHAIIEDMRLQLLCTNAVDDSTLLEM